jgi:hypothetical protein
MWAVSGCHLYQKIPMKILRLIHIWSVPDFQVGSYAPNAKTLNRRRNGPLILAIRHGTAAHAALGRTETGESSPFLSGS